MSILGFNFEKLVFGQDVYMTGVMGYGLWYISFYCIQRNGHKVHTLFSSSFLVLCVFLLCVRRLSQDAVTSVALTLSQQNCLLFTFKNNISLGPLNKYMFGSMRVNCMRNMVRELANRG